MATGVAVSFRAISPAQVQINKRAVAVSRTAANRRVLCTKSSSLENATAAADVDRRGALLGFAAAVVAATAGAQAPAHADGEYETFLGYALPPTSYGGYGGNAQEEVRYTFEYPSGWKSAAPNKVEKGTQGIDCRVFNPRNKNQAITVVTFGRAGEDNKSFRLTDIDTTIAGFAGADYDLQDALSAVTNKVTEEKDINGQLYYNIAIDSPDVNYLISVTVNFGKVYALFVKCPTKLFKQDEAALRHVIDTFRTV